RCLVGSDICIRDRQAPPPPEAAATPDRTSVCAPAEVRAEASAGTAEISFRASCPTAISGYNIYISTVPLGEAYPGTALPGSVEAWNHPVFPGDTTPEDGVEVYRAEGLTDGVRYYVHVRTVFPDQSLSRPSEEIAIVTGPRGTIELAARFASEQDGFSFAAGAYVRADDLANDLYFYPAEGRDFLASPDRLGLLRATRLRVLPFRGELSEAAAGAATMSSLPTEPRVAVEEGDWVQVMTADKTFALVKVLGLEGQGEGRKMRLFYVWSPAVGAPVF
ncbi:MAG: hypothetical protein QUT27_06925, partial [candidate division Zixibacteria bacterium]|nr:hypothetical protein [candidate division Zixibacteria bacterium]